MSIFEAFLDCEHAFDELYDATLLHEGPYHIGVMKDVDDYKQWAQRVGAAYGRGYPEYSLDGKLGEASILRDIVPKQLASLEKCVMKARDVVLMEGVDTQKRRAVWDAGQFDDGVCELTLPESKEYMPYESHEYYDDDAGSVSSSASEGYASDSTAHSDPPEATDLQTAVAGIRRVMQDLEALGLEDLEAVDGPDGAYDDEVASFENSDVVRVQRKFDNGFLADDVKRRLGKMITRCRQLLCDRRKESGLPADAPGQTLAPSVNKPNLTVSGPCDDTDLHLEVPHPPVELKEGEMTEFECAYCNHSVCIDSHRAWEEHIINDLQPYVCTYSHCSSSHQFFEDVDEWIEHEKEHDGGCFWCNTSGHETYEDQEAFKTHMVNEHGMTSDTSPFHYFWHRSVTVGVPEDGEPEEVCNLCFERTWDRKKHVARHLQQLAMYALVWEDEIGDHYETDT